MSEIQEKLEDLRKKKSQLENREVELKNKLEALEKKNAEVSKSDEERRTGELDFLKYQETQLAQLFKTLQETSMQAK